MNEQLIELETAKLAKEKGFDQVCDHLWNFPRSNKLETCNNKNSELNKDKAWYSAPTQSLLQKWLREMHNIHIDVRHHPNGNTFSAFVYTMIPNPYITMIGSLGVFDIYEEALEKGLIEALKLITL